MSHDCLDALPAARRETVRSALVAAFLAPIPSAPSRRLRAGITTASTFRLEGSRPALFVAGWRESRARCAIRTSTSRCASRAEAGIAPRSAIIDEAARIVVIDFIEQRPLKTYPGGPRALAQALGELFSRVQATPVFPYYVNYADIVARLFAHVRRTGLFAAGVLDAHVERLELIRETYNAGLTRLVSSHNDPTPGNILFDGVTPSG